MTIVTHQKAAIYEELFNKHGGIMSKSGTTSNELRKLSIRIDDGTYQTMSSLASKKNTTVSNVARQLISTGMQQDLAKESIDYIREQIHDEVQRVIKPNIDRLAKLVAKTGYATIPSFYLDCYILDSILPAQYRKDFEEIKQKSKIMAIKYLKLDGEEFADFIQSEKNSLEMLDLK